MTKSLPSEVGRGHPKAQFTARLPVETIEAIEKAAEEKGVTMSAVVIGWLAKAYEAEANAAPEDRESRDA